MQHPLPSFPPKKKTRTQRRITRQTGSYIHRALKLAPPLELPHLISPGKFTPVSVGFKETLANKGNFQWWNSYHVVPLFVRKDLSLTFFDAMASSEPGLMKPCQVLLVKQQEGVGGFVPLSFTIKTVRHSLFKMMKNLNRKVQSKSVFVPHSHFDLIKPMFPPATQVTPLRITFDIQDASMLETLLGNDWFYASHKFSASCVLGLFLSFSKPQRELWKPVEKGATFFHMFDLISRKEIPNAYKKERNKASRIEMNPSDFPQDLNSPKSLLDILPAEALLRVFWFSLDVNDSLSALRQKLMQFENLDTCIRCTLTHLSANTAWRLFYKRLWPIPLDLNNLHHFKSWRTAVHHHLHPNFNSWVWIQSTKVSYSFSTQKLKLEIHKRQFGEKNLELL